MARRMRSRGCEQCRRRRVKCDETGNFCRQCLRFGLDCSGPVRGVTIIDMTPEAAYPLERTGTPLSRRPRKVRKTEESLTTSTPSGEIGESSNSSGPGSAPGSLASTSPEGDQPSTAMTHKRIPGSGGHPSNQVPLLYQPSTADAVELFLVSQFLSFSQQIATPGLPRSWLTKIPELMTSSQVPAFRYSIRATITALHAKLHNDMSARIESYKWYIISLNKFRSYLSSETQKGLLEGNPKYVPGAEEILVPTFFCLFEALSNRAVSTPRGVIQHLIAACKILELRGPETCKTGLYHQMFVAYRVSSALMAISAGFPSRFSSESWRTTPFDERGKTLFHQLVDIMLVIPVYLAHAGLVGPMDLNILKLSKSDNLPAGMERKYRQLLEQLESWWKTYKCSPAELAPEKLFKMSELTLKYEEVEAVAQYSSTLFLHRDAVTALNVSLYNAISLILHTILRAIAIASERSTPRSDPSGDSKYHLKEAIAHSNSILHISTHHQEKKPVGTDFMRNMFPLKMVVLLSPPEQSEQARILAASFGPQQSNPRTPS